MIHDVPDESHHAGLWLDSRKGQTFSTMLSDIKTKTHLRGKAWMNLGELWTSNHII